MVIISANIKENENKQTKEFEANKQEYLEMPSTEAIILIAAVPRTQSAGTKEFSFMSVIQSRNGNFQTHVLSIDARHGRGSLSARLICGHYTVDKSTTQSNDS